MRRKGKRKEMKDFIIIALCCWVAIGTFLGYTKSKKEKFEFDRFTHKYSDGSESEKIVIFNPQDGTYTVHLLY